MENNYLSRKDLLLRPNWDLTRVQAFAHDRVKKSDTGRGRPSYLYLQSRVEAFERGENTPSELESVAPKKVLIVGELTDGHKTFLDVFDKAKPGEGLPGIDAPKAPSMHASVFNEGPARVSVVKPIVPPTITEAIIKHAPIVVPPTPKGTKPHITLITVDDEGKETIVPTPIVVD